MIIHILVLYKLFRARFWGFSILEETLFYFFFSKSVPRDFLTYWARERIAQYSLKNSVLAHVFIMQYWVNPPEHPQLKQHNTVINGFSFHYSFSTRRKKGRASFVFYFYNNKKRTLDSWSIEAFRIHFICCPISNTNNKSNTRKYCATKKNLSCKRIILCPSKEPREREREKKIRCNCQYQQWITSRIE